MNCPVCTFQLPPGATACFVCDAVMASPIVTWKSRGVQRDIKLNEFTPKIFCELREPYESEIDGEYVYNIDDLAIDIKKSSIALIPVYCALLSDPNCAVRQLCVSEANDLIIKAINKNTSLRHVIIGTDQSFAERILTALDGKPSLQKLTYSNPSEAMLRFMKNNPQVTCLHVFDTSPQNISVEAELKHVKRLEWEYIHDFDTVALLLEHTPLLESLRLAIEETTGPIDITKLLVLCNRTNLVELDLEYAIIPGLEGTIFWHLIAILIQKLTSLRSLKVTVGGLLQAPPDLFFDALIHSNLQILKLCCPLEGKNTASKLAELIRTNKSLKNLSLQTSYFSEGEGSLVGKELKENQFLEEIDLLNMGDWADYQDVLLENDRITSFKLLHANTTLMEDKIIATVIKNNILHTFEARTNFSENHHEIYEAIKHNTSLRTLLLNINIDPVFKEKKLMRADFAPFGALTDTQRLNDAIEIINTNDSPLFLTFGAENPWGPKVPVLEFMKSRLLRLASLRKYYAVLALQLAQVLLAHNGENSVALNSDMLHVIIRHSVPSYLFPENQLIFIVSFASRENLRRLVLLNATRDIYGYQKLVGDFFYYACV